MRTMRLIVRRNCKSITLNPNEVLSAEVKVCKTLPKMVTLIGKRMLALRLEEQLVPRLIRTDRELLRPHPRYHQTTSAALHNLRQSIRV